MQLYIGLATTAGIFIGILTALLINRLTNLKEEKSRLKKRIETLSIKEESLNSKKKKYQNDLNQIMEKWEEEEKERAREEVENFIERYVGDEFIEPIEELTDQKLNTIFSRYMDCEANEYHKNQLQLKKDEIESKLAKRIAKEFVKDYDKSKEEIDFEQLKRDFKKEYDITDLDEKTSNQLAIEIHKKDTRPFYGVDLFSEIYDFPSSIIQSDAAVISQTERKLQEKEQFDRLNMKLIETKTKLQSLKREKSHLEDKLASLNPSEIRGYLKISLLTIFLSVIIPILIPVLNNFPFSIVHSSHLLAIEPVLPIIIFGSWIIGLLIVFFYILRSISEF